MRKPVIVLLAMLALIAGALLIVPSFVDINRYRPRIQAELEKALGRDVSFGQIRGSLTPPSVWVDQVVIGEDAAFGQGPFASADAIRVVVNPWALARKKLEIRSLRLTNPHVQLIHNAAGAWNFASLGEHSRPEKKKDRKYELALLAISNGKVRLVDQQNGLDATYDNIDLSLENFAPGKPFDFNAAAHLPGQGDAKLAARGQAGPLTPGSNFVPVDAKVELQQVSLAELGRVAQSPALQQIQGIASGSIDVRNEKGALASNGSLNLEQPRIRGVDIGYPIAADYKLAANLDAGNVQIERATLKLGPTPMTVAGTVTTKPAPGQMNLKVSTQNASIAEVARLAAAFGVAFDPGAKVAGRLNADVHASGAMNKPALNGTVVATDVEISGGDIKQPVRMAKLELALSPAEISSRPFTAHTGGTTANGQFTLTNYTSDSPSVQATLRTSNANLAELLAMARAYGIKTVHGISGAGTVSLDVTASGPVKNASALVFNGSGQLRNASVSTPQLRKPVSVRTADIRFSSNSATLENLSASLDQTNATGALTIRNFAAPAVTFTLAADIVDLNALQQAIGSGPPAPPKTAASLVPAAHAAAPTSPVLNMTGSGNVTIRTLKHDQLVMNNVRSRVTLERGIVRLAPMTSEIYGGQQSGEIVLDMRVTPMAVAVSSKLQRVDANQLVSSVSNLKQMIHGLLAANANTRFQARNAEEIARTLSGTVSLNLTNGRIAQMDILNGLASVGRFLTGAGAQKPYTDIVKLTGSFDVNNGLAQTNNLNLQIPGASLAARGSVNLATNALNLKVTAVMSKGMSDKVGGTQIGGFMQTALANNKGELVLPVLITGTFQSPRFAPDMEQVARMKLENLVPNFGNPAQMTSGILGSLLGGQTQPGARPGAPRGLGIPGLTQPGRQQPENPLGEVLGGLLGGRKKRQQQQQQPTPQ